MTLNAISRYPAPMDRRSLYEDDIYAWAQQQADALRRLATRRDLPNELDLENVAEEIEDVGRSELSRVESYIRLTDSPAQARIRAAGPFRTEVAQ